MWSYARCCCCFSRDLLAIAICQFSLWPPQGPLKQLKSTNKTRLCWCFNWNVNLFVKGTFSEPNKVIQQRALANIDTHQAVLHRQTIVVLAHKHLTVAPRPAEPPSLLQLPPIGKPTSATSSNWMSSRQPSIHPSNHLLHYCSFDSLLF